MAAASFSSIFSSFVPAILLVSLLATPSFSKHDEIVDQVCSKTRNSYYCSLVLPHSSGVTLPGLASTAVTLAHRNALNLLNRINDAVRDSSNPQTKQDYYSCNGNVKNAARELAKAQQLLRSGNFSGLGTAATIATAEAEKCLVILDKLPSDPFNILRSLVLFEHDADIIMVINNMLNKDILLLG
ncbi:pectinesterase inhibitor-like [Tripterygium wilfordii]|uniref:Pectinesterase inhibitor-like n=1 Tax=Tripterygium wilfordii TaxID=458696 RepID=A0A7J7C669_TRIWF|nr:pectinesterase inhibitor-like [Tripterygium wilfordii]